MPITVNNPVEQPATETIIFDTFYLTYLNVIANPNGATRVAMRASKVHKKEDNSYILPSNNLEGAHGSLIIPNIYSELLVDNQTITLPSTLNGQGPSVTLSLADIIAALTLKAKQMMEEKGEI